MPRTALVIYGPGSEPIDKVRKITNVSTGALGVTLCGALRAAGIPVRSFRAAGSLHPAPPGEHPLPFESGTDLVEALRSMPDRERFTDVFHLAALPDFRVAAVLDSSGSPLYFDKIPSDTGELHLILRRAPKVIDELRLLFPSARLTGWKYELDGTRADAIARAKSLLARADLDCCVANGPAYGDGFGSIDSAGNLAEHATKEALSNALVARALRDS
jgi:phosphopantothenoylcysteine synthetase/decarboxylase